MNKKPDHLELMRQSGQILHSVLIEVTRKIRPGVTGIELDQIAERLIEKSDGKPAFKYFQDFPATLCLSLNDQVVHGIPSSRKIKDGDLISIDAGVNYHGAYTDSAVTVWLSDGKLVTVEQIKHKENLNQTEKLMLSVYQSLIDGIKQVKAGNRIGQISEAVQKRLERNNLSVVRDLVGHGVGHAVHEKPNIPNYGSANDGPIMRSGQTIAIEPMATTGNWRINVGEDKWTITTADGSLSAHFEHTVLVTENGYQILT